MRNILTASRAEMQLGRGKMHQGAHSPVPSGTQWHKGAHSPVPNGTQWHKGAHSPVPSGTKSTDSLIRIYSCLGCFLLYKDEEDLPLGCGYCFFY